MSQPVYDARFARTLFPFFETGQDRDWAFFDNAGGTFVCGAVLDRLTAFYRDCKVQPYGANRLAHTAGERMDEGRAVLAELLGVETATVTLGPSTTQNLNTLATACRGLLSAGDEIIVTEQDHEANIGSWERTAKATGATFKIWPLDPQTGELDIKDLEKLIGDRTRFVCLTHSSNIVGTVNPVQEAARLAHEAGARMIVDGVSFAPHRWPDPASVGADAYCFSTYKTYATHLGTMYIAPDFLDALDPQCHFFNVDKPYARMDAAGPDHASIAALAGLGDMFSALHEHHFGLSMAGLGEQARQMADLMQAHERTQCARLLDALKALPVRIIGRSTMEGREANVALVSEKHTSTELGELLADRGVAGKTGHFYAYRLLEKAGVDPLDGVLRLSFSHYTSEDDTTRLIDGLKDVLG